MPNSGYPDDDGSRDPGGVHGEAQRTGNSLLDVGMILQPTSLAQMRTNADSKNQMFSGGDGHDCNVPNRGWAVDGVPSAGTAAYPPKPEDPNARD